MTSPKPISDLQSHLGYWLRMVSNGVSRSFARKVEAEGVTVAEWVFLRVLHDIEPTSPTRLAERMGMTKGAISKLGDRLCAKSLASRSADAHGRGQLLSLTDAGRRLVPRLAEIADLNDAEFFGSLRPEQRAQLDDLLRTIAAHRGLTAPPTE